MCSKKHPTRVSIHCYISCWTKILAALTFILISSGPTYCDDVIEERFITIPALKRVSQLGYLYNERTDTFIPVGVFRRTISNEFITQVHNPYKRTYTEITDSIIDTFNFFSIDQNTAINILAGLTKPQGALNLLKGKTHLSPQEMTGTLLFKYQTVIQILESFQDGLKENFNRDIMGHIEATHVVTAISWGSQVAVQVQVQLQSDSTDKNNTQVSRNLLRAQLRSLRGKLTASDSDQLQSKFSMTVTSDISLPLEIPTTGQEVKDMLGQVPTLINELNEGKGIPLSYTLTPINLLRKHLGVIRQNTTAHKLNEFSLNELIEVFQQLQSAQVQLHQLNDKIRGYSNSNCFPQQTGIKLADLQTKFRNFQTNFTTTVKNSLIQVRSGLSENTILNDLIVEFSESDFEPENLRRQIEEFDKDIKKLEFCRNFQNPFSNIKYFGAVGPGQGPEGQEDDLINSLTKMEFNFQSPISILFTKFEFVQNEPAKYTKAFNLVMGKRNETTRAVVFVNCDFSHPFCDNISETSVFQFQNGSLSEFHLVNSTDKFPTCSKGSCLNGGTCIEGGQQIFCECAPGFIGEFCEDTECAHPGTCSSAVKIPPSCKCKPGFVKDARDPAKCQSSTSDNATLIFGDAAGIQQFSISQHNTTRINLETSLFRGLDFHYRNKRIFWSANEGKIYSAPIFAGASKTLVHAESGSNILSIAVDWIHNNIYYTDNTKDKIYVAKLDGSMRKVLINNGLGYPTSIVVNPLNGWMYWVESDGRKIERAGMDGTRRQIIATTTSDYPYGLTLDYAENRLYWTTYLAHPCSIYSMNPDGSDLKLLLRAPQPTFAGSYFRSITIFEDYMYWRDGTTDKIYRANKCNGEELVQLISDPDQDKVVQVYHFSRQPAIANQCNNRILQCSHLCLPIPGKGNETLSTTCACPDGRTLSSDGHKCSL